MVFREYLYLPPTSAIIPCAQLTRRDSGRLELRERLHPRLRLEARQRLPRRDPVEETVLRHMEDCVPRRELVFWLTLFARFSSTQFTVTLIIDLVLPILQVIITYFLKVGSLPG